MAYCFHCMTKLDSPDMPFCPECGNEHSRYKAQDFELPVGAMLLNSRYIVGECFNSDSFSLTYIGRDLKKNIIVTIKEIYFKNISSRDTSGNNIIFENNDSFDFNEIKHQISRECIKLLEEESLTNIAKVYDWFEENNTEYIICEYISDLSISDRAIELGGYEWNAFYHLFRPVLENLDHLHKNNIYHKNIKPSNIKIRKNIDNIEEFVLTDFGFAYPVAEENSIFISNSPYEPVEQRNRAQKDSDYTDVYAAAATIYYALTATEPLSKPTKKIDELFPLLKPYRSSQKLPDNVYYALKYGLQPDFKVRCQSISTFMERLDRTQQPVTVKTDNSAQPALSRELTEKNFPNDHTPKSLHNYSSDEVYSSTSAEKIKENYSDNPIPTAVADSNKSQNTKPNSKTKIIITIAAAIGCLLITGLLITGITNLKNKNSTNSDRELKNTSDTPSSRTTEQKKENNGSMEIPNIIGKITEENEIAADINNYSDYLSDTTTLSELINDALSAYEVQDNSRTWNGKTADCASVHDICAENGIEDSNDYYRRFIDEHFVIMVWDDTSTITLFDENNYKDEIVINGDTLISNLSQNNYSEF